MRQAATRSSVLEQVEHARAVRAQLAGSVGATAVPNASPRRSYPYASSTTSWAPLQSYGGPPAPAPAHSFARGSHFGRSPGHGALRASLAALHAAADAASDAAAAAETAAESAELESSLQRAVADGGGESAAAAQHGLSDADAAVDLAELAVPGPIYHPPASPSLGASRMRWSRAQSSPRHTRLLSSEVEPAALVELADLRASNDVLRRKVSELTATNNALEDEVRTLALAAQDREYYKDALEGAERQLRDAIGGIEAWKKEVAAFKALHPDMDSVLALQKANTAAQVRIAELEAALDASSKTNSSLQAALDEAEAKVAEHRAANPVSTVLHLTQRLREQLES